MENSKDLGKKKVKEDDLGTVSGGCGKKKKEDDRIATRLKCKECNHWEIWKGDYLHKVFKCPTCGRMTFRGDKWMGSWT